MKLSRVQIRNFRSIRDITLKLEPRCRVMVGINEAGKTNILRALAMLSETETPKVDDVRVQPPNEDILQDAYVRFVFSLDRDERLGIYEQLLERVIAPESQVLVIDGETKKTLAQMCDAVKEGLYTINVLKPGKAPTYWKFPDTQYLADGWCVPTKSCPDTIKIKGSDDNTRSMKSALLVHKSAVDESHHVHLAPADVEVVQNAIGKAVMNYVQENLPDCIFWTHSDSHLIPARLALDSFAASPGSCLPLKHAFILAGIDDIAGAIATAKKRSNGMRNLLDRVASRATRQIREVWPEYKGISLDLRENGPNIEASVNDVHNLYDFARRSDGFKRFISFLLMISAPTKTRNLSDVLILIDDPDAGLHPSGARYVRDELIRIAESNYVVYATHSIFMIDRERIARHIIVTKKDEITSTQDADESTLQDEEVLFNALGFSFADILKKKNIIFEGWRDKELFRTALSRVPAEFGDVKSAFADWGICHVEGVKDVRRATPVLELAQRDCIIVSDGDAIAREHQRIHVRDKLYGSWVRYDELLGVDCWITAEDFIKPDFITAVVESIRADTPALAEAKKYVAGGAPPFLESLDSWLSASRLSAEAKRVFVDAVKTRLFSEIKPAQILPRYFDVLRALLKSGPVHAVQM